MARRSGLGRGLDALIPSQPDGPGPTGAAASDQDAGPQQGEHVGSVGRMGDPVVVGVAGAVLQEIPIAAIEPNRYQPRSAFVDTDMHDLTESVRALGVLQPILVRRADGDQFELIAGERRWRAARAAGLDTVPAIVREAADEAALAQALVENLQRADLNPIEEAVAYQRLVDEFSLTQDAVAARVGKSRSAVTNTLRLLQLADELQDLVRDGVLSAGHARVLVGLADGDTRVALARRAVAEGWSVRQMEQEAKRAAAGDGVGKARRNPVPSARGAAVLELESILAAHLDTTVDVRLPASGKGSIIVHFSDLDDLERIYRAMGGAGHADADGD